MNLLLHALLVLLIAFVVYYVATALGLPAILAIVAALLVLLVGFRDRIGL